MKGILFKQEMFKAIIEGRKMVTRRLQNPQPAITEAGWNYASARYFEGEAVYIKEAWRIIIADSEEGHYYIDYKSGEARYQDDHTLLVKYLTPNTYQSEIEKWRSPMFLPEKFARYFLRIKSVRPERLQEITLDDCKLEGIHGYTFARGVLSNNPPDPRWAYIELWDSINKKTPWASNPWVWRYEFERVKKP